ncbi:MAG TPA: hypothetical protein VF103_17480, partial [Polyangiaceae bacterium]
MPEQTSKNRVAGKILTREDGAPVPDLLVVAYDYDPAKQQQLRSVGTALEAGRKLPDLPEAFAFWDSLQSDRLGSVLSDERGQFVLEFDDDLFKQRQSLEARPDLWLFVLAPEDTSETSFYPEHPLARLLHLSYSVRAGAGRTESYLVRIPRKRLESFGVSSSQEPSLKPALADPARLVRSVEQRLRVESALASDSRLTELLQPIRNDEQRLTVLAKDVLGRLLRTPANTMGKRFVLRPQDKQTVQAESVDERLERFRTSGKLLTIELDDDERELAATAPAEFLSRKRSKLDLVRDRTLLEACRAKQACDSLHGQPADPPTPPADPPGSTTGNGTSGPTPTLEQAEAVLMSKALGQAQSMSSYDPTGVGQRADPLELKAKLDALELRGGPADGAAFYDFHTLQIAFEGVWQRAFDKTAWADGSDLFKDWVRVRRYLGRDEPSEAELEEIQSLDDLVRAIESDSSAAAGVSQRSGTHVSLEGNPTEALKIIATTDDQGRVIVAAPGRRGAPAVPETTDEQQHLLPRVKGLLLGLSARLAEPYAFDIFAKDTFNFGLLTTYRQKWQPEA